LKRIAFDTSVLVAALVEPRAVFDALHLLAAERQRVDAFATFNPSDFERLVTEDSPRIVVPPDPPRFAV
jgi:predicted nucleic acid-binding protein